MKTCSEKALEWNVTPRTVNAMCKNGRIQGAVKEKRTWLIPDDAEKPLDGRISTGKYSRKKTGKEKKTLPVGISDYVRAQSEYYYVDKTLLIKEFLDRKPLVSLFTRPRRFGKTLNMDMLRVFFEISEDDTSKYFTDKAIWKCGEKYRRHQGKYPVIFLTFKDVKFDNWKDSLEAIRLVIRDEYMRHAEILSWDGLDVVEKDYLDRMQKGTLSNVEYTRALLNLSRMLEKYHNKKIVVLIDEYDTPIQQGHSKGFYNEVITFMRNFMSGGLKDNLALAFGVLTGILRVSKENLFSGLNNLVVNSVLDEKYSEYFGFTSDEVTTMAAYYGREDKLNELQEWYDGYLFGNREIYNPWSVANYFNNECKPRPFWTNTSDNEIIREIMRTLTPEIADDLILLMQGKHVQTSLNMDVIYPRITDGADSIFSFLLMAGYLKPVKEAIETEIGTFMELALPNKEIRRVYNSEILFWLKNTLDGNVME